MRIVVRPITLLRYAAIASPLVGGLVLFPIGETDINLERVIGLIGIALIPFAMVKGRMAFWLLLYWAAALSLALAVSPISSQLVPAFVLSLLPLGTFALFQKPLGTVRISERFIRMLFLITAIGGPTTYYLATNGMLPAEVYLDVGRSRFLSMEANIFGTFAACITVLFFPYVRKKRDLILLTLGILAVFLSFSRGPYLALGFGAVVYFFAGGFLKMRSAPLVLFFLGLGATFAGLAYSEFFLSVYDQFLGRTGTISQRFYLLDLAWQDTMESWLIGRGPLEFGIARADLMIVNGSADVSTVWIWQMFVAIWHDSGLIGLTFYTLFLLAVALGGFKLLREDGKISRVRASYLGAFAVVLLTSQTTTLHLSPFFAALAALAATPSVSIALAKKGLSAGDRRLMAATRYAR